MHEIIVPPHYNYIGAFLTLRCNLGCKYCLNDYGKVGRYQEMPMQDWIDGLSRIQTRVDLPITFQGGEPTIYSGFYTLANNLHFKVKHLDLLTNGMFDLRNFCTLSTNVFKRGAKYASIRVSFHSESNPMVLATKVWELQNRGYEIGIWGLGKNQSTIRMAKICQQFNIDFRVKEFLSKNTGTYKYPEAHRLNETKEVMCKPHELLIGPSGHIFRCHADLYANRNWIAHISDKEIPFAEWMPCTNYGKCNPCDVKLKTNRLQEGGYCSVEIRGEGIKEVK